MDEGDEPPWTWLRKGIPFELMGFGYDGLHELWDGYREGLSALVLLVKPPDSFYEEPDGLRVAWLESATERIPQETIGEDSPGRHTPGRPRRGGSRGHGSRGRRWPLPGSLPRRATSSWTPATRTGTTTASPDPWEDEIIEAGTEEWRKATALMDSVCKLGDWLEEDLPGRFAEMLDVVLGRLPNHEQEQEDNDHD